MRGTEKNFKTWWSVLALHFAPGQLIEQDQGELPLPALFTGTLESRRCCKKITKHDLKHDLKHDSDSMANICGFISQHLKKPPSAITGHKPSKFSHANTKESGGQSTDQGTVGNHVRFQPVTILSPFCHHLLICISSVLISGTSLIFAKET